MFRHLTVISLLALAVVSLCGDDRPPSPKPKPGFQPHLLQAAPRSAGGEVFAGRAVAITLKSDPEYGIYLEQPLVQRLGQNSFLVGTGLDSGIGEWTAGRRLWVAVDDISEIIEFKDVEELRETLEPADEGPDA